MEKASLIKAIDDLLQAEVWDKQEAFLVLQEVRDYLLAPPPTQVDKISKLTDLIDLLPDQKHWSAIFEYRNDQRNFHLIEKISKRLYSFTLPLAHFSLSEILVNPDKLSNSELTPNELTQAFNSLRKLIICCPTGEYETLSLEVENNLKIDQISWLNPSVGLILSELEQLDSLPTLAIWTGKTTTEFAYLDLPNQKNKFSSNLCKIGSIQYGYEALIQDLFCHMIYPQWKGQLNNTIPAINLNPARAGQADWQNRNTLKIQLDQHPLGHALLKLTVLLAEILQFQGEYTSHLRKEPWQVQQAQYDTEIVSPYLEYLMISIESILKITIPDVKQVIYGGKLLELIHPQSSGIFSHAKLYKVVKLEQGIGNILNYPDLFV